MSDARSSDRVTCEHCGLPVPGNPGGDGPHFCCPGCRAVYAALHEAGLDDFYDYRQFDDTPRAEPIGEELPEAPTDFDATWYLEEHTEALDDGTRRTELYLEGVHCAGCVWITEKMPRYVDGVVDARLDLSRAVLTVRWDPDQVELSEAVEWLTRFGYQPHPIRSQKSSARQEGERRLLIKVGACWAIAANVMLLAFALYAGLDANEHGLWTAVRWLSLGLSAVAVGYGGVEFFRRAWLSIRSVFSSADAAGAHGSWWDGARDRLRSVGGGLLQLSMDVPISLGILVGWTHSAWATVTGTGEIWFDSITVLIAALLTARWLQARGRRAAGDAADRLLSLVPKTARRIVDGDTEESVAVEQLEEGDVVEVRPGEVVPADGVLMSDETTTHRAVLTGESRPERLYRGDAMHAGETNLAKPIRLRVDAAGADSRVGRLVAWVEERTRKRAPIVQLADRLGGVFVLATILIAAVVGFAWWQVSPERAVSHVVALLVVACPCALGMATPLALTVGVGRAARRGIYIKHDDVIEALPAVDWVVLDKTGTLTEGAMSVSEKVGSDRAVELAAALESRCNHPIARAIAAELDAQKLRGGADWAKKLLESVSNAEEHAGCGITGEVDGLRIAVGKPDWIGEQATDPAGFSWMGAVGRVTDKGHSPVAVAVEGRVEAVIGVGDPIREESAKFLRELKRRDIQPVILSGDHPEVVRRVAEQLDLEAAHAHGGAAPEEKAAFVEKLAAEGRVMMVGDGVNDAAALQTAHIGVSVGGGAEASLVAADVFMTRPGLGPVFELVEGGERVMGVVHRNLWMSALYNVVAVGAAAAGLVGPLIAAIIMPMSSAAVVVSSLLQRSYGPQGAEQGAETTRFLEVEGLADEHPVSADSARSAPGDGRSCKLLVGDAPGSVR
ncbi:MAG: heavy metal translocating P-type ATPase [Persicimonas sp.]